MTLVEYSRNAASKSSGFVSISIFGVTQSTVWVPPMAILISRYRTDPCRISSWSHPLEQREEYRCYQHEDYRIQRSLRLLILLPDADVCAAKSASAWGRNTQGSPTSGCPRTVATQCNWVTPCTALSHNAAFRVSPSWVTCELLWHTYCDSGTRWQKLAHHLHVVHRAVNVQQARCLFLCLLLASQLVRLF